MKYRNIVFTRQMEGDKTLIIQGLVFKDPEALKKQTFYRYTDKALDNIRKSVKAEASKRRRRTKLDAGKEDPLEAR